MNLGVVLKQLDRLADAELHLRRAIAILEARLGPEHPDLGNGLVNLSNVLRRAHRPDEALAAVERARTIYESTLPGDHPSLARAAETEARILDERAPAGGSR
jgi:tetratricopeptide (TPR) repeat protein